jgi:alanine dehydrogenase
MKIGILKESKVPQDARSPLTPFQCAEVIGKGVHRVVVQSSNTRSFADSEFVHFGVPLTDNVDDCDVILGVKEVPIENLISNKIYFFFSHTIKKQPYNKNLLRAILDKNITLIDYEVLTDKNGMRLIAFGKFAGMVGAHNALWTYGKRTGTLVLPRMGDCKDYKEVKHFYENTPFPDARIVLTGTGRVANGAAKVLDDMGFRRISPANYQLLPAKGKVYTQLGVTDYAEKNDGSSFTEQEYFDHPENFIIHFDKYYSSADIMINGIYWDSKAPAFFDVKEMSNANFNIKVIADITCDIAPESSIPSTIEAATIENPVFGFNPRSQKKTAPFLEDGIDMMTIDNLPNELPRDASEAFGEQFFKAILPELGHPDSDILARGTIASNGELTPRFKYLTDYVK